MKNHHLKRTVTGILFTIFDFIFRIILSNKFRKLIHVSTSVELYSAQADSFNLFQKDQSSFLSFVYIEWVTAAEPFYIFSF